jgi:hypothetical protein
MMADISLTGVLIVAAIAFAVPRRLICATWLRGGWTATASGTSCPGVCKEWSQVSRSAKVGEGPQRTPSRLERSLRWLRTTLTLEAMTL